MCVSCLFKIMCCCEFLSSFNSPRKKTTYTLYIYTGLFIKINMFFPFLLSHIGKTGLLFPNTYFSVDPLCALVSVTLHQRDPWHFSSWSAAGWFCWFLVGFCWVAFDLNWYRELSSHNIINNYSILVWYFDIFIETQMSCIWDS